jgi:outer membrane biosynthesis protein TonB
MEPGPGLGSDANDPGHAGRNKLVLESRPTVDAGQRFGLLTALILSILLHALLVLFSVWFPFSRSAAVPAVDRPEETITFSFAENVEPTTDDPLEDSRFRPIEPAPNEVPDPLPVPEPPESPPVEAAEPDVSEVAIEEEIGREEDLPEPEPTEVADQLEPPGAEWRDRPDAVDRQAPVDPEASPSARDIDMERALRSFARAMAGAQAAPQPPAPPRDARQNVIVPDFSRLPYSGFGMGNLVFESRDYDWSDYGRQVYMAIWRAWHNRLWMTTDDFEKWAHRHRTYQLDHMTQVRFVIERNGQVTGIAQEAASGCDPLDASALEALAEVILPPLPPGFPRDREIVHARFLAQGRTLDMRPHLGRLRAAGYF